jgi:hypothetical protein
MDEQLGDAFEVCLAAMHSGVKLDNCLALYPDMMLELRAALEGARYAQLLERSYVPIVSLRNSHSRFRMRLAELEGRRRLFFPALRFSRLAFVSLLVVLVCALSWNGLLVASAKSLPGDRLYPVKRAAEKIAMSIKIKAIETNGKSDSDKGDSSETISSSSDNKQDDSKSTSRERDHEEHNSGGEDESGD